MNQPRVLLAFTLLALASRHARAQSVATRLLSKPDVEIAEPFSDVVAVRELRDGRVIVVDGRELKAQAVDFKSGTVAIIGRNGQGPGEYQWPMRLFALSGDTTLLQDGASRHFLVITPDAKPGDFIEFNPAGGSTARVFIPRSADKLGRLYSEAQPIRAGRDGTPQLADSSAIERLDRATGRRDTVALHPLRKNSNTRLLGGGFVVSSPNLAAFPAWDQWVAAPDGRIAFIYYDPYHVDYALPDKSVVRGKTIAYDRVKVDDALRKQWREERERPVMTLTYVRAGGTTTIGPQKRTYQEPSEWPEYLPPYTSSTMMFSSDNVLWIQRATAAGLPPTFDLIGGKGELVGRVILPPRTKLIGFGTGTVYIARMDDDDLQYLQRYSLTKVR